MGEFVRVPFVELYFGSEAQGFYPISFRYENTIGGRRTSPEYVSSFSYTDTIGDMGDTFQISLVDPNWTRVESKLIEYEYEVAMSWGYTTSDRIVRSPKYAGRVTKYKPTFAGTHIGIDLEGISLRAKEGLYSKGESYTDDSGAPLLIHEIVEKICVRNRWKKHDIAPTVPVYDYNSTETDEPTVKLFKQEANENDIEFITKKLMKEASTPRGLSSFYFYFDKGDKLVFKPLVPGEAGLGNTMRTYTFYIGRADATVLSWAPEITPLMRIGQGGAPLDFPYVDQMSKETNARSIRVDDKQIGDDSNKRKMVAGRRTDTESKVGQDPGKVLINASANYGMAKVRAHNEWLKANNALYKATMVVVGDPKIETPEDIFVQANQTNGRLHFSSSVYTTKQITHSIGAGSYDCTMELFTNALMEGMHKAEGRVAAVSG